MTKQPIRGQTSTPAGWTRTQAPTAPSVVIVHPADWRGSLVATMNHSSVAHKIIIGPKQTLSQLTPQIYIPMLLSANW